METFLVQVWVPADDVTPDADIRGLVRHIATGVEVPFRGDEEVLRALRRASSVPPDLDRRRQLEPNGP